MLTNFVPTAASKGKLGRAKQDRKHSILHSSTLDAFTLGGDFHIVFRNFGNTSSTEIDTSTELPPENAFEIARAKLREEMDAVVSAYRLMLRESLSQGGDADLKAALNRARVQEKLLASVPLADQAQACTLLSMSTSNPSSTMKRKVDRGEVLRFTVDGRAAYPLFQFDVEGRRIFPVMRNIIRAAPKRWSNFRILHWLTRPHLGFDTTPAAAFGEDPDKVLQSFKREIELADHG